MEDSPEVDTDPNSDEDIIEQNNEISIHNFSVSKNSSIEPLPGTDEEHDVNQQEVLAQEYRTQAGLGGGKTAAIIAENVIKEKAKKSLFKRGFKRTSRLLGRIGSLPVQAFLLGMGTAYAPNKQNNITDYAEVERQEAYVAENEGLTEKEVRMKDQLAALKNTPYSGDRPPMFSQRKK